MTTGNSLSDNMFTKMSVFNGSNVTPGFAGSRLSRVWSGGDSFERRPDKRPYRLTTYTVPQKRKDGSSRLVTRKHREYFEDKPRKKSPNPYSVQFEQMDASLREFDNFHQFDGGDPIHWGRWSDCSLLTPPGGPAFRIHPAYQTRDPNKDIALVQKLREKLRGSDFNMSVFLGEGHQTLQLIGDTAVKVARAYSLYRQGNIVAATKTLLNQRKQPPRQIRKKTASNWLELQYGWLPLLSDMREGAIQLAHRLNVPMSQRYSVRNSNDIQKRGGSGVFPMNTSPGWSLEFENVQQLASRQIVAYIREPESIPKLLGLMDPELVAWELVPFSFVVDWFAPVGSWLEARAFSSSLNGLFVTTDFQKVHCDGFKRATFRDDSISMTSTMIPVTDGGYRYTGISVNRSVSSSLSVPMPKVKPLNKALSFQHCLNGLAVLSSVVLPNSSRKQQSNSQALNPFTGLPYL